MMEEIWKAIVIEKNGIVYDYTGLYEVSNLGRVRSLNYRNNSEVKILKPTKYNRDYLIVGLYKDSKMKKFLIHRLVATMFIPNPDNLQVVNHKDRNKQNNSVENLEWCTQEYNTQYSCNGANNPNSKTVVCVETGQIFYTIKEATDWCGGSSKSISLCLQGKQKTAYGYHWQRVD